MEQRAPTRDLAETPSATNPPRQALDLRSCRVQSADRRAALFAALTRQDPDGSPEIAANACNRYSNQLT